MSDRGSSPIACTLQSASYHERLAWIADLAREGLRSVNRDDLRLELTYAPHVGGRVREMVAREQECCAFLNFELTEATEQVRLTITAPERAREVVDAVFDRFAPRSVGSA